jgi:diguanylate cyclase (GGDEF)-like protein/PAS domain S-box-containing protein
MMTAFVAPILLVSAAALLVHPTPFHLSIVFMLAAFGIVLASAGRTLHQSVNADLRATLELVKTGTTLANAQGVARIGGWELDARSGRMIWSPEMFRILGLEPSAATPSLALILEQVHAEDRERVEAALNDWLASKADLAIDHRLRPGEGATRWVHQFGLTQQDGAGRPTLHTAIVQDISDRKEAEEKLQFANVVMKRQMEASQDGLLVVSKERRIISFNERFAELFGCPLALLEGGDYHAVLSHCAGLTQDPAAYRQRVEFFSETSAEDGEDELALLSGTFINRYTVKLNAPTGDYLGRAWFFRDVTQEKAALAQAVRTARLDQLTGLTNRGAFVDGLRAAIAEGAGFAVLYVDLDHFKDVNDALGHPAGDELLGLVAERLRIASRPSDTIARFGGDEFALIVPGIVELAGASRLAAGLIKAISEPYAVGGVPVRISASIGIALFDPDAAEVETAETMLSHADLALYRAKAEGRSEYRSFTAAMDSEVRIRVALGAELHDAIDDGQLFLMYQPKIQLGSGRVVGVEALVRWRHPARGVLGPGLFIPIAEQTGVIGKLGQWVLSTACRQTKAWLDAGGATARVAINVSPLQFKSALAFETDLDAALADADLAAERVELELTETVLMNAAREDTRLLPRLRERGLTIAIDDFGTGYSSLDYLRRYPVNRIKIAQEFVRDLEVGTSDAAIVRATIGLGRELGAEVIAEGVETFRQLELLQAWGCGEVQGYYFAKPLAAEEIMPLLLSPFILQPAA